VGCTVGLEPRAAVASVELGVSLVGKKGPDRARRASDLGQLPYPLHVRGLLGINTVDRGIRVHGWVQARVYAGASVAAMRR
jgi:hypothetical protein